MLPSSVAGSVEAGAFEPTAVSFISPARGWLLGRAGCPSCAALRVTTDGGRHWTALPAPRVRLWFYARQGVQARAVTDLTFADSRDGFMYGPGLYATHDGGKSWRVQHLAAVAGLAVGGGYVFALTRIDQTDGHAALWRTAVGQDRWTRLPIPAAAASPAPTSVYRLQLAVDGANVVLMQPGASGPRVPAKQVGRFWVSVDAGERWRVRTVPCTNPNGPASVFALARHQPNTWLVDCFDNEQSSQEQNTQHHLFRSGDAGRHWTRLADPTRHNMPAMLADNGAGDTLLATDGVSDTLVGSFDGDRHWQPLIHSGGSFFGWADLRYISTHTAFVVGPTHYAPEHLYRTDDGGRHWRMLRIP
jgi:photosystem II stability/assembly factor-like uncharacterized protein